MESSKEIVAFLIKNANNPEIMSGLRRSIGIYKIEAIKYLCQFTKDMSPWEENVIYSVGGLFSLNKQNGPYENDIGKVCSILDDKKYNMSPVFKALLQSNDINTIEKYLKKIINQASNNDIHINWARLIDDLFKWKNVDYIVQHRIAKSFYDKEGNN